MNNLGIIKTDVNLKIIRPAMMEKEMWEKQIESQTRTHMCNVITEA